MTNDSMKQSKEILYRIALNCCKSGQERRGGVDAFLKNVTVQRRTEVGCTVYFVFCEL